MAIENFQSARHSLAFSVYYRVHRCWARRKNFKIRVLRRPENANLRLVLGNTGNKSFIYVFFQLLYKIYVTFNTFKNYLTLTV